MTEEELARKFAEVYYGDNGANPTRLWIKVARWHLKELKKAELQTLITVRDIPGKELYLLDRITELQSELRKLEEVE